MAAAKGPIDRLRTTARSAFHRGIRRVQDESPPNLSRQLARLDRWVRARERAQDRARKARKVRISSLETDIRTALARGVNKLETFVRP